jgi:hypothetical protein
MANVRIYGALKSLGLAIQSLCVQTYFVIEKGSRQSLKNILMSQGVHKGCTFLPVLFNL